nr:Chain I, 15-mer peptide from TRAF-interacting protein with FHA domain-containing protein A [Homo sapiens]
SSQSSSPTEMDENES